MVFTLIIGFFILGTILASFTCVIAERLYTGQSWLKGRSRCNSCRRTLESRDLVPVFSWVVFRGRCRTCRAKVPAVYAVFESILGFLFALTYVTFGVSLQLFIFLLTLIVLAFIVLYDLRHTIVPWASSILLIILSLLFAYVHNPHSTSLEYIVITALVISLAFFLVYALSRGRAMGLGDAPIAFALSILVGSAAIPGLLFSFWVGGVVGVFILLMRRGGPKMGIEVPFVPFMAIGYLIAFFTQWNPLL